MNMKGFVKISDCEKRSVGSCSYLVLVTDAVMEKISGIWRNFRLNEKNCIILWKITLDTGICFSFCGENG